MKAMVHEDILSLAIESLTRGHSQKLDGGIKQDRETRIRCGKLFSNEVDTLATREPQRFVVVNVC